MAITNLLTIKTNKDYRYMHLPQAIPYACNPDKTRHRILTGAYNCLPETALKQMIMTKERFDKTDQRQGYHFIISFVKGEVAAEVAYQIVDEFVKEYLAERYEVVFGVYDNKEHIHGHIVCNSVSLVDGRKYHYANGDWKRNILCYLPSYSKKSVIIGWRFFLNFGYSIGFLFCLIPSGISKSENQPL